MKLVRIAGACALALLLPACATVVRGTKEAFVIDTDPPGALAALSTGEKCTTPCSLKLKRKAAFTAHLTRDGYEPVDANVTSETRAGAVAGNILLGGIIGAGVDASNGSLKSLVPNPLHVKMVAMATPATIPATSIAAPVAPATSSVPAAAPASPAASAKDAAPPAGSAPPPPAVSAAPASPSAQPASNTPAGTGPR